MTAAISNLLLVDPTKSGKHAVIISDQFRNDSGDLKRELINVQRKPIESAPQIPRLFT